MKRPNVLILLLACLALLAPTSVWAQPNQQEIKEIAGHDSLSDADKDAVKAFVKSRVTGLSGKPKEIRDSREAIYFPLESGKVTLAFRTFYASELLPALTARAADNRDEVAFNACRIMGELASTNTVDALINALKDPRPSIQYAAVQALGRSFEIMGLPALTAGGAVVGDQVVKAINAIGTLADGQIDWHVLEGSLIALAKAVPLNNKQAIDVQGLALSTLCKIGSKQCGYLTGKDAPDRARAILRVALTLRTIGINQGASVPQGALKDGATFAGDLLTAVAKAIKAGNPDKLPLEEMARAAEAVLSVVASSLQAPAPPDLHFADSIKAGKSDLFLRDVQEVIGPGKYLASPPYSIDAKRFKVD